MDRSRESEDFPPIVGAKYIPKHCRPEQRYAYRNGAAKLSGSIVKELARKPEVFRNLESFQPKGGLQQRQIVCGPTGISVEFSSPLQGISDVNYIQTHKRADLINDKIQNNHDDDDDDSEKLSKCKSTVIAVDCKWKNGIKLKNAVSASRSREINPNLKTIDLDFESKMKFAKDMDQLCQEHFPDDNVLILEGNNSHGSYSLKYSKHSPKATVAEQEIPYDYRLALDKQDKLRPGTTTLDPCDVENIDYNDLEEHKVLLVPSFSKSGFEVETAQRYKFPYTAKFLIDSKKYERSFELQLPVSESPQHFGLIFTFPEKQGKSTRQINVVIKSMISIYSVFPHSSRHASLTTYEFPDFGKSGDQSKRGADGSRCNANINVRRGPQTQAKRIAKDYVSNMSDTLREEKLVPVRNFDRKGQFVVNYDLKGKELCKEHFLHPKNSNSQYEVKHKIKQNVLKNIKVDRRET